MRSKIIKNKYFLLVFLALVLFFLPNVSFAANYYITPTGSGNKTGTDWNNTIDWSAKAGNTLERGSTYYIAGCSAATCGATYAAKKLDTPANNSQVITIKKATISDHGTDIGWTESYGNDQAVFMESINFTTAYWTFDGIVGSGSDLSSYGFRIQYTGDCLTDTVVHRLVGMPGVGYSSAVVSNIIFSHTAMPNCGKIGSGTTGQIGLYSNPVSTPATLNTISNNYFSNGSSNLLIRNWNNSTISGNYFNANWSSTTNHGQQISPGSNSDDITLKNNIFKDSTVFVVGSHPTTSLSDDRWLIYNNIVIGGNMTAIFANANSGTADGLKNWQVHNNTIDGATAGGRGILFIGILNNASADKSYAYNNLVYNTSGANFQNGGLTEGAVVSGYNAYFNSAGTLLTEPNAIFTTGNPFIDPVNGIYTLANGTGAVDTGKTLASPYDIDMASNMRGQGLGWDIGAYEYVDAQTTDTTPPAPPTGLIVN